MTRTVHIDVSEPRDDDSAGYLFRPEYSHGFSGAGEHLTYPRRPSQSLPKKSASWHQPIKQADLMSSFQDEKFSPANLLNCCPVLDSDSDDSEDDSSIQPKRLNVLMEKDFEAGVQELRKQKPRLFPADSTRPLRNSAKHATYPRSLPGPRVLPGQRQVPVVMKPAPHPPPSKGYDASGNGSTELFSTELFTRELTDLPSPLADEE